MKLKRISEASMQEIVKAFSEYQYEAQEEGLYYLCKGKSGTEAYMKGFALAGIKSGWLHTISEKEEGYIMISCMDASEIRFNFIINPTFHFVC